MSIQEAETHQLSNTDTRPETRPDSDEIADDTQRLAETALSFDGTVIDLRTLQIDRIDQKIADHESKISWIKEIESDGVAANSPMTLDGYNQEIEELRARRIFLKESLENDPALEDAAIAADLKARAEFDEFQRRMPTYMYRPPSDY